MKLWGTVSTLELGPLPGSGWSQQQGLADSGQGPEAAPGPVHPQPPHHVKESRGSSFGLGLLQVGVPVESLCVVSWGSRKHRCGRERRGGERGSRKERTAKGHLQSGRGSLTFWGCELNVILLAEGGWEDGVGGGVVTEPVRAICGGPPIHTDHQVAIQENLEGGGGAGREHGITSCTPTPGQGGSGGDTRSCVELELDLSFPELLQSSSLL